MGRILILFHAGDSFARPKLEHPTETSPVRGVVLRGSFVLDGHSIANHNRDVRWFPFFSLRWDSCFQVWRRNYLLYRRTWKISFFWTVFEPLLYLLAIGVGLGAFVNQIGEMSYLDFLFPALLCNTAMIVPYFETTYSNYSKLRYQKIYSSMMLTPLGTKEIVIGEILWGASKGIFAVIGVYLVSIFWSLMGVASFLIALPVLVLLSLIFSCVGMSATSYAKNYDWFVYLSSGVIIPLSLFSNTYFPIADSPLVLRGIVHLFPLVHGVDVVRDVIERKFDMSALISVAILVIFLFFGLKLTLRSFEKRLVAD